MSDPARYTVAWICALPVEYVAAQELLDEEHESPSFVSPHDAIIVSHFTNTIDILTAID
jgi:hypothetical protein